MLFQRDRSLVTLEVAEGQTQVVTLADGSTVRVLGGSRLTYADPDAATPFNRRVHLDGRAFFEVVPGQQGFTVETPSGVTTVLGTSFGIQADAAAMDVVLASGRVAVASRSAPDQVVVLEPGQRSRVAANARPTTPEPIELTEALTWTGLFVFRATPLRTVAERLQAHYEVPVQVVPTLADERVTGTFEQEQPLTQVLRVLATTVDAEVRGDSKAGYILAPAS
jgi:ferric-dicitrate binding protein FerR (iron transport regulator)